MLKVKQNIDTGLWVESNNGIITSVFYDLGGYEDGGVYILNHHQVEMPAHKSERHETIVALVKAMREVEPDLRKWCYSPAG